MGPFSGGQLTALIITFAVLLLFPLGAWAVSFSNVAITDPGGVNRAKVDAKSNLNTAIHDANTGTAAKVNGFGQLSAAVTGSVNASPAAPSQLFRTPQTLTYGGGHCAKVVDSNLAYPQGGGGTKAEVVTQVSVALHGALGATWRLYRDSACSDFVASFFVTAQPGDTANYTNFTYQPPSGVAVPAGQGLYAYTGTGDVFLWISATGYLVPATAVPSNG